MKKILLSSFLALFTYGAYAQTSGAVVTVEPASFTAEDQIKITVDVSAVGNLAGIEPLYLWAWVPNVGDAPNGQWTNSNENQRMTREAANVWSFTLVPSEFYSQPPGRIRQMGLLVKAKDGTGDRKTDDIILSVDPLEFSPVVFRTFPARFTQDDIVTIYYDQKLDTANGGTGVRTLSEVYMFTDIDYIDELGEQQTYEPVPFDITYSAAEHSELRFESRGDGVFTKTMIPAQFFADFPGAPAIRQIVRIKVHVRSAENPFGPGAPANPRASLGDNFLTPVIAD